jgi:hypothetical protein
MYAYLVVFYFPPILVLWLRHLSCSLNTIFCYFGRFELTSRRRALGLRLVTMPAGKAGSATFYLLKLVTGQLTPSGSTLSHRLAGISRNGF